METYRRLVSSSSFRPLSPVALAAVAFGAVLIPEAAAKAFDGDTSLGVRVGGWGFRDPEARRAEDLWRECRMNGIGVFVDHPLAGGLFVEVGADAYFSDDTGFEGKEDDARMDRVSGLLTAGLGLRSTFLGRLGAYLQTGLGLEATRVRFGGGDDLVVQDGAGGAYDSDPHRGAAVEGGRLQPVGFFGFGADLRLVRSLRAGAVWRGMVMGQFGHDGEGRSLEATPEMVSQMQFYLRWSL